MERFLKFCADLDELGYFNEADTVFLKYAAKHHDLLKKQILIPIKVKEIALKAYREKNKDIKFGSVEDIEIARQLSQRSYLVAVIKIRQINSLINVTMRQRNKSLPGHC